MSHYDQTPADVERENALADAAALAAELSNSEEVIFDRVYKIDGEPRSRFTITAHGYTKDGLFYLENFYYTTYVPAASIDSVIWEDEMTHETQLEALMHCDIDRFADPEDVYKELAGIWASVLDAQKTGKGVAA